MAEKWRQIQGYEGLYSISSLGRVKSHHSAAGLIVKQQIVQGYFYVDLHKYGVKKSFRVHRLVATAFVPNPESKPEVNHKDGDKLNNAASNLEWCTRSENTKHAFTTGLQMPDTEKANKARRVLSDYYVKDIKCLLAQGYTQRSLAEMYGVSKTLIGDIKRGKAYKDVTE